MRSIKVSLQRFPRKSILIFLVGVFFLFTTAGIVSDILSLGRQTVPHYLLGVLLSGLAAMVYATAGFALRQRFWKAFFPIFFAQMILMNVLARLFPNLPYPTQMGAADIARLQSRLNFNGIAMMAAQ